MGKKITKIEPVKQKQAAEYAALKRVCAYCRVSTGSAEQKNSLKHRYSTTPDLLRKSRIGYWLESMRMKHEAVQK